MISSVSPQKDTASQHDSLTRPATNETYVSSSDIWRLRMGSDTETNAIVAANLTKAWALRSGVKKPDPKTTVEDQVLAMYDKMLSAVRARQRP